MIQGNPMFAMPFLAEGWGGATGKSGRPTRICTGWIVWTTQGFIYEVPQLVGWVNGWLNLAAPRNASRAKGVPNMITFHKPSSPLELLRNAPMPRNMP